MYLVNLVCIDFIFMLQLLKKKKKKKVFIMHYLLFMYLGRFICLSVVFSCICVYQCGVINCSKPMHCVLSEFSTFIPNFPQAGNEGIKRFLGTTVE